MTLPVHNLHQWNQKTRAVLWMRVNLFLLIWFCFPLLQDLFWDATIVWRYESVITWRFLRGREPVVFLATGPAIRWVWTAYIAGVFTVLLAVNCLSETFSFIFPKKSKSARNLSIFFSNWSIVNLNSIQFAVCMQGIQMLLVMVNRSLSLTYPCFLYIRHVLFLWTMLSNTRMNKLSVKSFV